MAFLPSLSPKELRRYHRGAMRSATVRSHFDVFDWLQGDMQQFLPHDIMIVAWGNFESGAIRHDIISALDGVRSQNAKSETIAPLLQQFFQQWAASGHKPVVIDGGEDGFTLISNGQKCDLGKALQRMRCAMVHGMTDERSNHVCLYAAFSAQQSFKKDDCGAMAVMLPYIDMALRQVAHLPHQTQAQSDQADPPGDGLMPLIPGLSEREAEVLHWVAMGKTNPEVGSILELSEFTIKNHLHRIFKKMNVSNRAQAVGKLKTAWPDKLKDSWFLASR